MTVFTTTPCPQSRRGVEIIYIPCRKKVEPLVPALTPQTQDERRARRSVQGVFKQKITRDQMRHLIVEMIL